MTELQSTQFYFKSVPQVRFASNCILELAEQLAKLRVSTPLIVTDQGIMDLGLLTPVLEQLRVAGIKHYVYSKTVADPPEENVEDAVSMALRSCCDGVVGFGGGSSMDVAKLVAVLMHKQQTLQEIYGVDQIQSSRAPLVQIPTTAGTGSEATSVAIVTTGESTKAGVVSERLFADAIFLDPLLTVGLPPLVTAATGIDAMVHAIEAFTSKRLKNPISDMLALQSLMLMSRSIRAAVHDGANISARSDMLLGAMMAGQAFANAPVGAVHALAYPLGGVFHIPHGLSNSLVLPHVLRFNGNHANEFYGMIVKNINFDGLLDSYDSDQATEMASTILADYFLRLALDLGLPTTLLAMGISSSDLPELAKQAMLQERLLINNPRVMTYEHALNIYQQAYE
jgi:alcohol dehydrogenase